MLAPKRPRPSMGLSNANLGPGDSVSQANASRIDRVEDRMDDMQGTLRAIKEMMEGRGRDGMESERSDSQHGSRVRRRGGEDNQGASSMRDDGMTGMGRMTVPLRGPHGTFPFDLEEQYAFIEPLDLDAALAGSLNPMRLHRLLDPSAPLFVRGSFDEESTTILTPEGFVTKNASTISDNMFRKLCKGLPSPTHFLTAWSTLINCMAWSNRNEAADIIRAMTWYGNHIVELSNGFTWESCLRVFVDHAKSRLCGRFNILSWYDAANASQQQKLLVQKTTVMSRSVSFAAPGSFGSTASYSANPTSSSVASKPVCRNFNEEGKGCTYDRCRRSHVCGHCGRKGHGEFECSGKKN